MTIHNRIERVWARGSTIRGYFEARLDELADVAREAQRIDGQVGLGMTTTPAPTTTTPPPGLPPRPGPAQPAEELERAQARPGSATPPAASTGPSPSDRDQRETQLRALTKTQLHQLARREHITTATRWAKPRLITEILDHRDFYADALPDA